MAALGDAPPAEALRLAGCAAAVASSLLAIAQVLPQTASALTVGGDVLIDAFVTDRHLTFASDLLGTPAFDDARLHRRPDRLTDTRLRACRVSTLRALSMRRAARTLLDAGAARYLEADRAATSLQLLADLVRDQSSRCSVRIL